MAINSELIDSLREATGDGYDNREAALNALGKCANSGEPLERVRSKPCADCAVTHGLYTPIAACAYKFLTPEEKEIMVNHWFCHRGGRCEGAKLVIQGWD